jgi:hypothetical protein
MTVAAVGVVLLALGLVLAGAALFLIPPATDEASRAAMRQALVSAESSAAGGLASVLRARAIDVQGDPLQASERYVGDCAARARQASRAAQRGEIERVLHEREQRETAAADGEEKRAAVLAQLRQTALQCGCADTGQLRADELVGRIECWRTDRSNALRDHDRAREDWAELQALLEGKSLDDLCLECARVEERANQRAADFEASEIEASAFDADRPAQMERLRGVRDEDVAEAQRARGQVAQLRRSVPDVASAEEQEAEAGEELARVEQLERTLTLTADFLRGAQETVHRSIAPVLQASVEKWLPAVTAGRYRQALVDPQSLRVTVRDLDGRPRDAALLSRGTAEQIYLLLRAAMAQHLTKQDEVCPLILDDITVHCDAVRKAQVLAALHALSQERQIILFTQEEPVLGWAEANFAKEQDRIERLDAAPIPA